MHGEGGGVSVDADKTRERETYFVIVIRLNLSIGIRVCILQRWTSAVGTEVGHVFWFYIGSRRDKQVQGEWRSSAPCYNLEIIHTVLFYYSSLNWNCVFACQ